MSTLKEESSFFFLWEVAIQISLLHPFEILATILQMSRQINIFKVKVLSIILILGLFFINNYEHRPGQIAGKGTLIWP